jgi:uncharacterized RDD family membrane protein YckC
VNNPQPIAEPLEPAGLARRLVALGYDSLLVTALLFVFLVALFMARDARGGGPPDKPWIWVSAVTISALFFCGFWTHGGQTSGMRAWRIRVVRDDGGPVGWGSALLRFVAAWASALPLGLGYWWSLFDPRRRCWHDRLSRTAVVLEPKRRG